MADGPIMLQKDNTFTKLFVGGLPYHTTNETLKAYFLQFGEIEEAVVIHDRVTQKSKGYGFVTMKEKEGAERACAEPYPNIDGRKANVNLAYIGAKPKPNSHPTSPLSAVFPMPRSDSPTSLFPGSQNSSPPGLPLPPPGLFIPSPPPPHPPHFFQDSPPFSPPLFNHVMVAPYFNGSPPPFGYMPPSPHLLHGPHHPHTFIPQMVPFNAVN